LIPASYNADAEKYRFKLCSCKVLFHILIWQIGPFLLISNVDGRIVTEDVKNVLLVKPREILHAASSLMAIITKLLSIMCTPFTLAILISKAKLKQNDLQKPQNWFQLTLITSMILIPVILEIYQLFSEDIQLFDIAKLASMMTFVAFFTNWILVIEMYLASFCRLASRITNTCNHQDLANIFNNLIDVYDSMRVGLGPYLLFQFTVMVMNLVSKLYLTTQVQQHHVEGRTLNNIIPMLSVSVLFIYLSTSCEKCYNHIMQGRQILRYVIQRTHLIIGIFHLVMILILN
jgi:hypothetical protein